MATALELTEAEEYRPAGVIGGVFVEGQRTQIERGWQIRMEDGLWLSVTRTDELYDTTGRHPNVTRIHLEDGTHVVAWSEDEVIMSRRLADPLPAAPSPLLVEIDPYSSTITLY